MGKDKFLGYIFFFKKVSSPYIIETNYYIFKTPHIKIILKNIYLKQAIDNLIRFLLEYRFILLFSNC